MPKFLYPIIVSQETVTGNETISGNETVLGVTSGKGSFWDYVNVLSGVSADNIKSNTATFNDNISSNKIYGTILDWMSLVRGYKTVPTLSASLPNGDVYTYTYKTSSSDLNYYRYIANDGSVDEFYSYFSSNTLSGLVASKQINL